MIISRTRTAAAAALAVAGVLIAGLLLAPAASATAALDTGAATLAAGSAFKLKTFQTPSGNIQCAMLKSGGRWSMRCDVFEHDWTAPPRRKPCEAGDYGSSVSMGGKAKPRFICVSDAIGARKVLKYGKVLNYGPFTCNSRRKGLTCWNKLDRGWFLSRESYSWNG